MRHGLLGGQADVLPEFPGHPRNCSVSPDWPLMRRILALLADDDGLADAELAEQLSVPLADVRQAARILYRQRRIDMCAGYMVAISASAEGRRAA